MTLVEKIDHKEQAKDLMLSQFEESPNIQGLLASWIQPLQNLEDDLIDFMGNNGVSNARGPVLDIIGSWMGVERSGRTDQEYRLLILGKAIVEEMDGTTEKFYQGFKVLINSNLAHCYDYYYNDLYALAGSGYSPALATELKKIAQAGTRVHLMVVKDLDYVTVATRDVEDNALVTDQGDPYEVLVDGELYPLTTTSAGSAGALGTNTTFGWGGVTLPNQAECAFEVVPYKVVEGLVVDDLGNQMVDSSGNKIKLSEYSEA